MRFSSKFFIIIFFLASVVSLLFFSKQVKAEMYGCYESIPGASKTDVFNNAYINRDGNISDGPSGGNAGSVSMVSNGCNISYVSGPDCTADPAPEPSVSYGVYCPSAGSTMTHFPPPAVVKCPDGTPKPPSGICPTNACGNGKKAGNEECDGTDGLAGKPAGSFCSAKTTTSPGCKIISPPVIDVTAPPENTNNKTKLKERRIISGQKAYITVRFPNQASVEYYKNQGLSFFFNSSIKIVIQPLTLSKDSLLYSFDKVLKNDTGKDVIYETVLSATNPKITGPKITVEPNCKYLAETEEGTGKFGIALITLK